MVPIQQGTNTLNMNIFLSNFKFQDPQIQILILQDFTEYVNFEESLAFIEDYMVKHGPFDGLLGFSQGAILSAGLPGLQAQVCKWFYRLYWKSM